VRPGLITIAVSARTGQGMDARRARLTRGRSARARRSSPA